MSHCTLYSLYFCIWQAYHHHFYTYRMQHQPELPVIYKPLNGQDEQLYRQHCHHGLNIWKSSQMVIFRSVVCYCLQLETFIIFFPYGQTDQLRHFPLNHPTFNIILRNKINGSFSQANTVKAT